MTTCSTNQCGTGLGTVTLPNDPDNNSLLTASSAFGGIDVSWTMPATNPHAVSYVKIYRGIISSFDAALLIANASGSQYFDRFNWSTGNVPTYYYWIQFVSINGTVGEVIGPAAAVPQQTIDQVIEQLTAKIDYGMLSVALKGTVDKAELYKQAQDAVNSGLSSEQISIRDAIGLVQADVDQAFVLISNEVTARQSAGTAFAQSLNTLAVSTGEDIASVQTTLQASIDDVSGTVDSLYTVKLTVNNLCGGFGLTNNGTTVEAGFDVDKFWIGRTNTLKRKPFIVSNNTVYIDEAAIEKLTFTKLQAADGTFVVSGGKISGDYLNVNKIDITSSTNFKVKSSATGARMELTSSTLKVYDTAGTLRVKIGNLA